MDAVRLLRSAAFRIPSVGQPSVTFVQLPEMTFVIYPVFHGFPQEGQYVFHFEFGTVAVAVSCIAQQGKRGVRVSFHEREGAFYPEFSPFVFPDAHQCWDTVYVP